MTLYSYRLTVAAMRPNARFWHKAAMVAWEAPQSLIGGLTDSLRDQCIGRAAFAKK